jgi:predicted transposase/invertase (TIGR01784 family)
MFIEDKTMSDKVTPRVDIAFKKLFGVEENKDLLISLINSIVSKEDQVLDVEILNPYNPQNFKGDKLSILDIKAKTSAGQHYNIEMQVSSEHDYDKRALYYWAELYAGQLCGDNKEYSKLKKTIGIHILNFLSIPEIEKYHNVFNLCEKYSGFHHFKDIELHTIELCKFEDTTAVKELGEEAELKLLLSKIKTSLDRWAAFLSRCDLLSNKPLPKELADPKLEKALGVLEVMNFSKEERDAYEEHLKWLRMENSALKKVGADAFIAGKAEGKAEGLEEGKVQGLAEGQARMAKNMLRNGMNKADIAAMTELSVSEIERIEKEEVHLT